MAVRNAYIRQPGTISPSVGGFIDFWTNGVRAAETHITVAKHAVEAGMPLNHFVGVTRWSLNLLWRIFNEHSAVDDERERYSPHAQFRLDRFEHDVLNRRFSTLGGILENFSLHGKRDSYLHDKVVSMYHFHQDLHAIVGGVISRIASLYPHKDFDLCRAINGTTRDRGFKNERMAEAVRIILENLVDNAIKHAPDGYVQFSVRDRDGTIIVEDGNGGLEPGTPEKLFAGTGYRERRVVNDEGPGIGWPSMLKVAEEHGWILDMENRPGKGMAVIWHLNDGDLVDMDSAEYAINLDTLSDMTAAKILAGASSLVGIEPFAVRHLSDEPDAQPIDVSGTSIYAAIRRANMLVATHFPQLVKTVSV